MAHPVTCGVIAGGASSRMGSAKSLLPFQGRPLLERQLEILRPLFERVVIGANDATLYASFGADVVPDILKERCALTGVHAVISASRTEHVFVVACDMPFLNPRLIEAILARRSGADVVVPESDSGIEPLHALYSRSCLDPIEACALGGAWKVSDFYAAVRVDRWRVRDDEWMVEGRSPFLNVNTPEEWRSAGT